MKNNAAFTWRLVSVLMVLTMFSPPPVLMAPLPAAQAGDSGWHSPSADGADTGGDGNGFEVFPIEAYADGGDFARNVDGYNDRHRYYNFGFDPSAFPSGAVIAGIEVRLDGWADSTSNTPRYDMELSWNGGTSWSNVRSTSSLGNSEATFFLGGQNDLWGHTWSADELADENLRVRITSRALGVGRWNRDFFLDWVTVHVYYVSAHIIGTIWADDNANGVQEHTEAGLDGVHVTLYQDDGDGIFQGGEQDLEVGSGDTDAIGVYDIGPFMDGYSYWIDVITPTDHYLTTPPVPRLVPLPNGSSVTVNFGYALQTTQPAVAIAKAPKTQMVRGGDTVTFTIAITNTGDVSLSNVIVSDALAPNCQQTFSTLGVGQSQSYNCTRANVTADFVNTGSVSGAPPVGAVVTATDTAFVDVINPAIQIAKTPDTQMALNGSTVTFTIAVTNTGEVPLTNVSVSDALAPNCARSLGNLAASASQSYRCALANVLTDFTNSVTVTGMPPIGTVVTNTDTAAVTVIHPAIAITKTPKAQTVRYGDTAAFTIAVTNTGDVSLSNVTISDAIAPDCARPVGDLSAGSSKSYECQVANVMADFINTAFVTGTSPVGAVVTAIDTAQVELDRTQICPTDMIAYWKLDEISGPPYHDFYDGHDGQCAGQCPTSVAGRVNGGQAFNGSNTGIDVPAHSSFDWGANDSFSIEFWMQTPSASTCTGNHVVVGRDDGSTNLHWWVGCQEGGQAAFYLKDTGGVLADVVGTTDLTDGLWHHIAAVRDDIANKIRIYVDGTEENSTDAIYTAGFGSLTAALNIGWLNRSDPHRFVGTVDEAALYNRALPANEIRKHRNEGLAGRWQCEVGTFTPKIVSTPITDAITGQPFTYTIEAAGNPTPTYSLLAHPSGMIIDQATGMISWTPTPEQEGSHNVSVEAHNSEGTDNQSFTIEVKKGNPQPEIHYILLPIIQKTLICPAATIGYWKLDETSGPPYRDSNDGHEGGCVGQCPLPVVGRVDGGLAFNNTNTGINVPVAPGDDVFNWSVSDSFSIEFWMRTSSSTACSGGQVVVGRDGGLDNLHWWAGCSDGGRAAFYLRDTSGVLAGAVGTRNLTNGAWHHIVAVRDATATRIRIYVDGIEEGSTRASYAAGFGSPTAALNIGWINLSRQHHFEGTVDEVALYKRALFPNEIQQHYDKGQAGQGYCGE